MKLAIAVVALVLVAPLSAAYASQRVDIAPADPSPADVLFALALTQGVQALPLPVVEAGTLRDEIVELYLLSGAMPSARGLAELDARLATLPAEAQAPVARIVAAHNEATRLRALAFAGLTAQDAAALTALDDHAAIAAALANVDVAQMNLAGRLVTTSIAAEMDALRLLPPGISFLDPFEVIEIADASDHVHAVDRTLLIDLGGDDVWSNNAGATKPDFFIDAFPGCITTGALDCTILGGRRNSDVTNDLIGRRCHAYGDLAFFEAARAPDLAQDAVEDQAAQPSLPEAIALATQGAPAFANGVVTAADVNDDCLPQNGSDVANWTSTFLERGTLRQGDEHSVAIGIDLAGDDVFAPPREFNDINDGDNAAGCDARSMGEAGKLWSRNLTAGGAFAGIGVLWDSEGSDFYGGRSIAQGSGHVAGVGVLVDEGPGDNVYSAVRLSQGVGFFAGLGLLYSSGDGNDRYALENDVPFFNEFEHFIGCDVSTRDGQGRGNFNGVGALVDLRGDDEYFVQDHDDSIPGAVREDPRTTQASAGARLQIIGPPADQVYAGAVGILYDGSGRDTYTRAGRADNVTDTSARGLFIDWESKPFFALVEESPLSPAVGVITQTVLEFVRNASDQGDCQRGTPACDALAGDAGSQSFRPCRAEPEPANGLLQWLTWYAVQAAERREVFRPSRTPLNAPWLLPDVGVGSPDDPGPRVCEDRRDVADDAIDHPPVGADERAFYLPAGNGGSMSENAPSQPFFGPGNLVMESAGGASYASVVFLETPLEISRERPILVYLAHREPLMDTQMTYTTQVTVTVADAFGAPIRAPDGEVYRLAERVVRYHHDGRDVDRAVNWTDIAFFVNATGVLPQTGTSVIVPAGHHLVFEFDLVAPEGGGVGAAIGNSGDVIADAIVASDVIPHPEETPAPLDRIDLEEQLVNLTLRPMTRSMGHGIDQLTQIGAPASTFRAAYADAPSRIAFPVA